MAAANKKKTENEELKTNGKLLAETFTELEDVIGNLEKEDISLEEAFDYYKNGIELLKSCKEKLDEVEKKVLVLNEVGELDEF